MKEIEKRIKAVYRKSSSDYQERGFRTSVLSIGLLHWKEKRFLTIEEAKRLCSFPNDFKFIGNYRQQWARMGNAVMPNMMKAIASNIKNNILN